MSARVAFFRWAGGKTALLPQLLSLVPTHWDVYVEPYVGSGAVFFHVPPADFEVINDLCWDIANLYRVLQGKDTSARFRQLAQFSPYSRRLWQYCRGYSGGDSVERAWAWWLAACQCYGGWWGRAWGNSVTVSRKNRAMVTAGWLSKVSLCEGVHRRLQGVAIECTDGIEVIDRYDTEGGFIYCDPPYVRETRREGEYDCDLSDTDHEQLVARLLRCRAQVMVSGYDHSLYRRLDEAGWVRNEFHVRCRAIGVTRRNEVGKRGGFSRYQLRTEVVWRNYRSASEAQGRLSLF